MLLYRCKLDNTLPDPALFDHCILASLSDLSDCFETGLADRKHYVGKIL